ncbi:MAG: hypothetical protein KIC60_05995 [Clostridium sp.]|nr:hypothetical protein [Clostridium sp.]
MLKTPKSFKTKMKKYGKQLNMLLNFGKTTIDKTYIKSAEPSVNGELFTSIMRQLTLEVENYTSIEVDKILTVRQVNERKNKDLNNTRIKYLATDLDKSYTVKEVGKMSSGVLSSTRVKYLIQKERRENIASASTINVKLGVRLSEFEDYEYVDYGEYVVYDKEDVVDKNTTKLYLFDHLIDTHIKYDDEPLNLDYSNNDITVLVLLKAICNKFGFILKTEDFVNANKIINEDKYLGLNVTYRDILDEIAAVAGGFIKIFNKDLYVAYPEETGEVIDENDLEKLTIGKKIGAFNSLVLGRSPQEDNIYYPENIDPEDRVSIRIDNNQIMDRNRENFIVDIFNKIKGLEYYVFEFTSFGFGYFEFGDVVTLKNLKGEKFKTILFNIIENIDSGIKEKSYTEETNYSETKYEYATGIEKRLTNTEIICNKQDNQIKMIIEQQGETENKVNSISMDLESTELKIQNSQNETNEKIESLKQTIEGLTNNVSTTGGDNMFSYASENFDGNIEEYTDTDIKNNSVSGLAYKVKVGTAKQTIQVKNGTYTISFLYKKLVNLANGAIGINEQRWELEDTDGEFKEKQFTIEIKSNTIEFRIYSDTDDAFIITDLMCNIGNMKQTWSQNANETITDTVQIGKGISVKSSTKNTELKADADGVRINNTNTNETVAEFTDKGMETEEMIVRGKAQIAGMLVQQVDSQIWLSSLL